MNENRKMRLAASLVLLGFLGLGLEAQEAAQPSAAAQVPPGQAAQPPELPVLSLQQAIDLALSTGDDMKVIQGGLDAARAQHALNLSKNAYSLSANGGYGLTDYFGAATDLKSAFGSSALPGIGQNVQAGLSLVQGTQSSSSPNSRISLTATPTLPSAMNGPANTSVAVSLSQNLWDGYAGGQTKALVDKSLITLQGKSLAAVQGKSAVVAKVKQAYITALTAQRTLALRRSILEKQNALLKQFQTIYDLKQASAIDLLNAQINARSAALDVRSSEHDLSLALQRLGNTVNYPGVSGFQIEELQSPVLPASSLDEAIGIGFKNRLDIAQVALNRRSSQIDLVIAKASILPGIGLTGGLNLNIPEGSTSANAKSASLGVKIAMPILDAGAAKGQIDSASSQLGIYDAQIAQLQKSITADIRDAYESVLIQADRVDLAKQNMNLFDARFEVAKAQNAGGTMSNQDLFQASLDAANADVSYANAQNTYLLAVVQLQTAMGL